ncbi:AbrB family transcriptional regulator [Desulfosediminicola flagellatus]|uniref:AbrB family transcriptional regulator n=1 Tax=Desulfosediminicola flagellatus TaxID=2569541 RepID=UPI001E4D5790|nr:AbrB family transcriptional regulator [Desulfosediminicola flagellatus]
MVERYVLVVAAGVCGGLSAQHFNVPGGAVVGAMIFSGIMSLILPNGITLPPQLGTAIQIMLGISLGLTFDRSFLSLGAKALPLAILSTIVLLMVAVGMALLASRFGFVDFGTALFGFSPGGMSGMAVLAQSEGHKTPVVAFFHLVRIFTLFLVVPLLVKLFVLFRQPT